MLLMALSGAAVLALVWWVALRESRPTVEAVIPQPASQDQADGAPDRQTASPDPLAEVADPQPGELDDATVADADTEEALAAAVALWGVLTQDRG